MTEVLPREGAAATARLHVCPNCGSTEMSVFYEVRNVPVHSVTLLLSREAALGYAKGDIILGLCGACSFIANLAFDPSLHDYRSNYESTQNYSHLFTAFHEKLAKALIERYGLRGKTVVEIGCGQGEFLSLLCKLGGSHGIGFDPAYEPSRGGAVRGPELTIIKDYYSEKYVDCGADFVCCKMTLEHIQNTSDFIGTVRRAVSDQPGTMVFFQVPNALRILRDVAFWDIYYEHCSYFDASALANLFRRHRFEICDLRSEYDDQYLVIETRPNGGNGTAIHLEQPAAFRQDVARFAAHCQTRIEDWRHMLRTMHRGGRRVVLWGGGSKAVAFLTTLGIRDEVDYVVDINPHKHGTYVAGSGHAIVAPRLMCERAPDVVIIMNPIYRQEIQEHLHDMELAPHLIPVTTNPAGVTLHQPG
jgi:2-polyprenyl-3-methyl-5-hydroxy-6-metoxy-1,4-benzoquinol methylase